MQTSSGKPDRTLLVIISLIAVVAILALIVVFTRGAPTALDPSTPEGTVQAYANAVIAGDRAGAIEMLTKDTRENCDKADLYASTGVRMTLVSTSVAGDNAVVRVTMSNNSGGGAFGGSEYQSEGTFNLVQEGGQWKIDGAPWEFTTCYNQGDGK